MTMTIPIKRPNVLLALAACVALAGCAGVEHKAKPKIYASMIAPPDVAAASLDDLERRAGRGDTSAMVEIAKRHGAGIDGEKDYGRALEYLRTAAAKHDSDAQYFIGTAYDNGVGVEKDETLAALWFELSAKQHNPAAAYALANMIATGRGGYAKSPEGSIAYMKDAAEQGVCRAQFIMGVAYQRGQGVDQDPQMAANWYRRSLAECNFTISRPNLRTMIEMGVVEWQPGDPGDPPPKPE